MQILPVPIMHLYNLRLHIPYPVFCPPSRNTTRRPAGQSLWRRPEDTPSVLRQTKDSERRRTISSREIHFSSRNTQNFADNIEVLSEIKTIGDAIRIPRAPNYSKLSKLNILAL